MWKREQSSQADNDLPPPWGGPNSGILGLLSGVGKVNGQVGLWSSPKSPFLQAWGCSDPDLAFSNRSSVPHGWGGGATLLQPPRGHVAGAAGSPHPLHVQGVKPEEKRCRRGGDPKNGTLGFETHFLWALSFLALVLFFRAWSASTAGERDG